ncbi:MAPEG family protein [Shewanella sedimentimangrovi]|uniref:MAPEG family protein n=1 Tax=Shewanella sedimentimangrovi TaxID=2814293 RepID=A0ABX7QZN5_9GAMM|nr:MAPEG family protein [Shewanella sedimentimangrovi]QSX37019.1 MAPEG family protein [Shewanella sedimentimangrovi]
MSLAISGVYISLTAVLMIVLSWRVVRIRRREKIGVGSGGNRQLQLAMRAHGNLMENAPLTMLMLVVAESNGMAPAWLHLLGSVWLAARLLHAIGLTQGGGGYHFGRFNGTLFTWLVLLTLALFNLWAFIQG